MKKKVLKVKELPSYTIEGKEIKKVLVCFEKESDGSYYTGSHHYQKDTPFVVGAEIEFDEIVGKTEKQGKDEYPRIQPVKPQYRGGGGGMKERQPKTYQEYVNELAWQTQQQTILFMCHRVNIDPTKDENGVSAFEKYYNLFYQTALKRLQP